MKSKTKMNFRDKIKGQVEKSKESGKKNYGYLKLPKNVSVYSVDIPKKMDSVKVKFDIMPYIVSDPKHIDREQGAEVGSAWWRRPIKVHKKVGIDNENVICPTTFGKKCPICEYQKELSNKKADKDEIKALSPSRRSIYIVRPKDDKNFEDEYHIFDISDYCFYDPFMIDVEEQDEYNFPSLDDGKTVQVRFNKENYEKNSFPMAIRVSFFERDEQYDDAVLDEVPNLDEILVVLSYEELKIKFFEIDEEEDGGKLKDDEDDEDDKVSSKKSRRSSKKDDEDDDDDDKQKKSRSSRKVEKEPEPEPDPEEEDVTWEVLSVLSLRKIKKLIEEKELEVDPDEFDDDTIDDLRKAVAEELEIEIPKKGRTSTSKKDSAGMTGKRKPKDDEEEKEDENLCVACQGTGKNSKGRTCPICDGTGIKPKDDDDEVETKKEEKSTRTSSRRERPTGKKDSNEKCPHGHKFGKDTDEFDECRKCKIWDDCIEEKEK